MNTVLTGIFATALLCGSSLAQDPAPQTDSGAPQAQPSPVATPSAQPSPQQATQPARIAPGSVIPVQLTKTIDAKNAKTGDKVEAKVTQDLKNGNGQVLVPKDTKVLGRVTEAQARNKEQPESRVGIAFDRAVIKDAGEVPMPMSIQAIVGPPSQNAGTSSGGESSGEPAPAPASASGTSGNTGGRPSGAGGTPPQTAAAPNPGYGSPSATQNGTNVHQPITGSTQGVVGIPNLKLSTTNPTQGSLVSSEKNNVKLESGTYMLLRVNQ